MASILSISSIKDDDITDDYLNYFNVKLRPQEIQAIKSLCLLLVKSGISQNGLDHFTLGHNIKQISKEFDLLRVTEDSIINIELKTIFDYSSALFQLQRNRYYLKFITSNMSLFTFVKDTSKIYQLDVSGESLVEISPSVLVKTIESQTNGFVYKLDPLFDPKNYLISPFNTTERFINREYFLTNHQNEIKKSICDLIYKDRASVVSIKGSAGTGKSLLMYDIAQEVQRHGKRPLIVHCGQLNHGHLELIRHGFSIIPVKRLSSTLINQGSSRYDVIVIDEAQRLKKAQTATLLDHHNTSKVDLIFGHDKQQVLRSTEANESAVSLNVIGEHSTSVFALTNKIRSNENVANFIIALHDLSNKFKLELPLTNIDIVYFPNYSQAATHIKSKQSYTYIPFTPSVIIENHHPIDMIARHLGTSLTAHSAIGQEFDNVIVVLDQHFFYSDEGKLRSKVRTGNVYSQMKMLFQVVTRTKDKLEIVVVGNEVLFGKLIQLLT